LCLKVAELCIIASTHWPNPFRLCSLDNCNLAKLAVMSIKEVLF
jgi:hypothetical protein